MAEPRGKIYWKQTNKQTKKPPKSYFQIISNMEENIAKTGTEVISGTSPEITQLHIHTSF